jgi:DNA-binding CsgD family transcriptional regulator
MGADVSDAPLVAHGMVVQQIVDRDMWLTLVCRLKLSRREAHILDSILAFDEGERSIGVRLGISQYTVRTHLERLYRKLHVNSRCQLVARVFSEYVTLASGACTTKEAGDTDAS